MEPIPIYLLQSFITFNESKNVVEAAKRLGLSQPGLSKQLKQLEDFLPAKAFVLNGRKKVLTPFGRSLHEKIKGRIGNIQEVAREAWAKHSDPAEARVRISARRGILDRLASNIRFEGTLIFQEAANRNTIESLLALHSEIGIVHTLPGNSDLIARPLFKEEFQLVVPKKCFSQRPHLGSKLMSHLLRLPCLAFKPEDELILALFSFYAINNPNFSLSRATENYTSISEMVAAQKGWAILPSYIQPSGKDYWAYAIPGKALPSRQFYLVYRSEFKSIGWFKELIGEIQSCIK